MPRSTAASQPTTPIPTIAEESQEQLIAAVRDRTAPIIGIGFDGDADRIGVVDDTAAILLQGDQLMVDTRPRRAEGTHPGATIIADVKASQVLYRRESRSAGGNPVMFKTGHSLIKAKMAETGSPLAGEMSGHVFFAHKWYGFDDALYAAVRLLGIEARSGRNCLPCASRCRRWLTRRNCALTAPTRASSP